jgi:outer membrane protein
MQKFILTVAMSVASLYSVAVQAQSLQNISIEAAVTLAKANKPALRTYAIDAQIAQAQVTETRLRRNLKVSGTADAQVTPFLPASVVPVGQFSPVNPTDETRTIRFGTWWQATVGVNATKTLYDATIRAQEQEQAFQARLSQNNQALAETEVAVGVCRAYYALLLADEELRWLSADSVRTALLLRDAQQKQGGGTGLAAEVNEAQMQVNDRQMALEQARQNRKAAAQTFAFRIGVPVERSAEMTLNESLATLLPKISATANEQFDAGALAQNRAEFRQLALDNQLQALKIQTEAARLKPVVNASAFLGLNNLTNEVPFVAENSWFSNGNAAIRVTLPLSERWEWKKRTPQYDLKQQQNALRLADLDQQARLDFETVRDQYQLAKRQLPLRQRDLDLAQSSLALAGAALEGGGGLVSGVVNAQNTLQQKQYAYWQTAYNLLLAELDMRRIRGEVR